MLPQAVTYAAVLDRLNWAISRDWRVLEACHHVWAGSHNLVGLLKDSGAFEAAKAYLIEGATGLPAFCDTGCCDKKLIVTVFSSKIMSTG